MNIRPGRINVPVLVNKYIVCQLCYRAVDKMDAAWAVAEAALLIQSVELGPAGLNLVQDGIVWSGMAYSGLNRAAANGMGLCDG